MTLHLVWAVLGMLVLTFGIRLSFLVFGHRLRFPDCLQRSLRYVPAAVLTALIVPMALAPRLNGRFGRGYDSAPADVKPVLMTIAKLEHAARERRKESA